ncbi:hypothetical protein MRX96_028137 [Rhipicephalus microplus]
MFPNNKSSSKGVTFTRAASAPIFARASAPNPIEPVLPKCSITLPATASQRHAGSAARRAQIPAWLLSRSTSSASPRSNSAGQAKAHPALLNHPYVVSKNAERGGRTSAFATSPEEKRARAWNRALRGHNMPPKPREAT